MLSDVGPVDDQGEQETDEHAGEHTRAVDADIPDHRGPVADKELVQLIRAGVQGSGEPGPGGAPLPRVGVRQQTHQETQQRVLREVREFPHDELQRVVHAQLGLRRHLVVPGGDHADDEIHHPRAQPVGLLPVLGGKTEDHDHDGDRQRGE